jgi:hypothetical protein
MISKVRCVKESICKYRWMLQMNSSRGEGWEGRNVRMSRNNKMAETK